MNLTRSLTPLCAAILSISTLSVPIAGRAETEIIERNASIHVNGWFIKGDRLVRKDNGVVKAIGNAKATSDERHCYGTADEIVLNTEAGKITFTGSPSVKVDNVRHDTRSSGGALRFSYWEHDVKVIGD